MAAALRIGDIAVEVVRKDIKNVHLSVHPPRGSVRIAVPRAMSTDAIRAFAISRLSWIRQNQKRFVTQDREPPREYLERESHYLWGRRYLLKLTSHEASPAIEIKHRTLVLRCRPSLSQARRAEVFAAWYRDQLRAALPPILSKWQHVLGVQVARVFVQHMKTKWGSANPNRRTVRLNSELAKKPPEFLDYIVLHELAHFISPRHDDHFRSILDRYLPNWRRIRAEMNSGLLRVEDWDKPSAVDHAASARRRRS